MIFIKDIIEQHIEDKSLYMNASKKKTFIGFFDSLLSDVDEHNMEWIKNQSDADAFGRIAYDLINTAKKSKPDKAEMYNDFVRYINKAELYDHGIVFDEIPVPLNTLERRLDIIKNYGNKKTKHQRNKVLAEKYGVTEKVISADINAILSGELNVYGQEFDLDALSAPENEIKSTVVPVVLALNVQEVISMLEGLYIQKDTVLGESAVKTAVSIWSQLSDYVKDRIMNPQVDINLHSEWYEYLNKKADKNNRKFVPERNYNKIESRLLTIFKNGDRCDIEYEQDQILEWIKDAKVINIIKDKAILENGDELFINNILDVKKW